MSLFVTGIDTDIGKTVITAGLALSLRRMGMDVGVMKPFAAGTIAPESKEFKSNDVQIICNAARVNDSEALVNPQFFPMPASPYTAWKTLKIKPDVPLVLERYRTLSALHKMLLVEGIGGIMTPILDDYYVADLIKDLQLPAVIVTTTRVGSFNHTIMSVKTCERYGIPVKGVIINDLGSDSYNVDEVKRDLKTLLDVTILGVIPFIESYDQWISSGVNADNYEGKGYNDNSQEDHAMNAGNSGDYMYDLFKKNIDFKKLLPG